MADRQAPTKKSGKQSILSETTIRRHSQMIKGHSNMAALNDVQSAFKDEKGPKPKVKTFSDAARAEDHIQLEHMQVLMEAWEDAGGHLGQEGFFASFQKIIGKALGSRFEEYITYLFKKMDTNQDKVVDWDEFCTYMIVGLKERDELENERENPIMVCPVLFETNHRTTIVAVLPVPSPPRFMTVSESGHSIFWSTKLKVSSELRLDEQAFLHAKSLRVTTACYLANAFRICLATTNHDLRFFHSTTGVMDRRVQMMEIVRSLDYWFDEGDPNEAKLFIGDMSGRVTALCFNQAGTRLFNESGTGAYSSDPSTVSLEDVERTGKGEISRVTKRQYRIHREEGRDALNQSSLKILFFPELNGFFSCSSTVGTAVTFCDIEKDRNRNYQIPKGCYSFDVFNNQVAGHYIMATGGGDGKLRLWNPYVPNHAMAVMAGHRSAIMHVISNIHHNQVITISDTEIVKIWDIEQRVCLNTLGHIIPHKLVNAPGGRIPGSRVSIDRPMVTYWHQQAQTLLACTYTELAVVELSRDDIEASHRSHDMPISSLAYIPELDILASGCHGGNITCWNLMTGQKVIAFENAHTGAEVTCLTVDAVGGRRLISGASNGDIFVWNTLSGTVLESLQKNGTHRTAEVAGVFSSRDRVYTCGWGGEMQSFLNAGDVDIMKAPMLVQQDSKYRITDKHRDDATTMSCCGESLCASGSFDGQVIIWNLKLKKAVQKFDSRGFRLNAAQSQTTRFPKIMPGARTSVDRILWLKSRVKTAGKQVLSSDSGPLATLITSSDGGCICFWNAIKGDMLGAFYSVTDPSGSEFVQGLATNHDNSLLYTGDSLGYIRVYDIAEYWAGVKKTILTRKQKHAPPLDIEWRGHVQAISELIYVETSNTIISGSADCSVRVWDASHGDFIGTFGGSSTWDLSHRIALSGDERRERALTKVQRTSVHAVSTAKEFVKGAHGGELKGAFTPAPSGLIPVTEERISTPHATEPASLKAQSFPLSGNEVLPSIGGYEGGGPVSIDGGGGGGGGGGKAAASTSPFKKQMAALPAIGEDVVADGDDDDDRQLRLTGSVTSFPTMDGDFDEFDEGGADGPPTGPVGGRNRRSSTVASNDFLDQFPQGGGVSRASVTSKLSEVLEAASKFSVHDQAARVLQNRSHSGLKEQAGTCLGNAYSIKALLRRNQKQNLRRQGMTRPDMALMTTEGLTVCTPFNALRLGPLENISIHKVPSAVVKTRRKVKMLEGESRHWTPADSGQATFTHSPQPVASIGLPAPTSWNSSQLTPVFEQAQESGSFGALAKKRFVKAKMPPDY